jgi:phosphocarrier protein HPr
MAAFTLSIRATTPDSTGILRLTTWVFALVRDVYLMASSVYRRFVDAAETTLEIKNRLGLHLRAASTLAQALRQFSSAVTLSNGAQQVNARSVTSLMMLGAGQGTKLKVRAEGSDAQEALSALKSLFESRFGEE